MTMVSDIGFSDTVKTVQSRKGSREIYANVDWRTDIDDRLAEFASRMRSVFVATVNADGYPYIQHRGGPPGFLQVLDKRTIAFADYKGNRQYITQGNLIDNPKTFIFMIDYERRQRIKLWGRSEVIEDDAALLDQLMPDRTLYRARPEQVFKFTVEAWDINCPQHIPQRIDAEIVAHVIAEKDKRIAELEAALAAANTG